MNLEELIYMKPRGQYLAHRKGLLLLFEEIFKDFDIQAGHNLCAEEIWRFYSQLASDLCEKI